MSQNLSSAAVVIGAFRVHFMVKAARLINISVALNIYFCSSFIFLFIYLFIFCGGWGEHMLLNISQVEICSILCIQFVLCMDYPSMK